MTALASPLAAPRAPTADDFAATPPGWHFFCHVRDLAARPLSRDIGGRRLVAYRPTPDTLAVLDARCPHFGSDLGNATIENGCLQCPFHHWQYAADGRCADIPALPKSEIPPFARLRTYPHALMGPCLFVHTGQNPASDLPFFPGQNPADFTPSDPFTLTLQCPWYLVGANAFDQQHFLVAHDRQLESPPVISTPSPFSRQIVSRFRVVGNSWQDRFTRLYSGRRVTLTVTDHAGTLIFVTATFRRTTTFGLVNVLPIAPDQTQLTVMAWLPKSGNALGRALIDPLHAGIRRYFIRKFIEPDTHLLKGCTYHPRRLIAADGAMADYFAWLAPISRHHQETPPFHRSNS